MQYPYACFTFKCESGGQTLGQVRVLYLDFSFFFSSWTLSDRHDYMSWRYWLKRSRCPISDHYHHVMEGTFSSFLCNILGLCWDSLQLGSLSKRLFCILCREAIGKILARGHSRVPVYCGNPKNIIGLLLVCETQGLLFFIRYNLLLSLTSWL